MTEAIDRLEADRVRADAAELAARVAAIWSMVSEIDPELARLASGYDRPTERLTAGRDVGPASGERGSSGP